MELSGSNTMHNDIVHAMNDASLPPTFAIPPTPSGFKSKTIHSNNNYHFILDCINKERVNSSKRVKNDHGLFRRPITYPIKGILRKPSRSGQLPSDNFNNFTCSEDKCDNWQHQTINNNMLNISIQDDWRKGILYPANIFKKKHPKTCVQ